jgi:hypothetical protein
VSGGEARDQCLLVIRGYFTEFIIGGIGRHQLETIGVEGLAAESAGEEVLEPAEGPTEVAHLFEDEAGVVEGAAGRIRVVAPLIVNLLIVLHHQLLLLLHYIQGRRCSIVCQMVLRLLLLHLQLLVLVLVHSLG